MASTSLVLVGTGAFFLLIGGWGGIKTVRAVSRWQTVAGASLVEPGSVRAGQGPVELTGTARVGDQSFESPLTGQEAVAYRFEKEAYLPKNTRGDRSKRGKSWQTIAEEEAGAPFYVEGESGRVLVDGATADLHLEQSAVISSDDVERDFVDRIVAAARELGGASTDGDPTDDVTREYVEELQETNRARRYTEEVLRPGEDVYVYGQAVPPEAVPRPEGGDDGGSTGETASDGGLAAVAAELGLAVESASDADARLSSRAAERLPEAESDQTDATDESAGKSVTTGRDALDAASAVVSWDANARMLVSDGGKRAVHRSYLSTALIYAALTGGTLLVAGAALTVGLGLA